MIAMITGASLLGTFFGYITRSRIVYNPGESEKSAITFTSSQSQAEYSLRNYILLTCATACFIVIDRSGLSTRVLGVAFDYSHLFFFTIYYILVVSWVYYTVKLLKKKLKAAKQ